MKKITKRLCTFIEQTQIRWLFPFGVVVGLCAAHTLPSLIDRTPQDEAAYALGALVGHHVLQHQWKAAQILGLPLSKKALLQGVQDTLLDKAPAPEVLQKQLNEFFKQLNERSQKKIAQNAQAHEIKNETWRKALLAQEGMQKSPSGLLYVIKKQGEGKTPAPTSRVLIHCQGRLPTGEEIENTYEKKAPITLKLDQLEADFSEAILLLQEGGRIYFAHTPILKQTTPPLQGVLQLFDVELLAVDPPIEQSEAT